MALLRDVTIYWDALKYSRYRAVLTVFLRAVEGMTEGVALLVLIPILNAGLGGPAEYQMLDGALRFVGIDRRFTLQAMLLVFVLLGLATAGVQFLANRMLVLVKVEVEESLRRRMTHGLFQMDWSSFLFMRLGDINKAVLAETSSAAFGCQYCVSAVGAVIICIAYIGVAFLISGRLTLLTLAFAAGVGVFYKLFASKAVKEAHRLDIVSSAIANQTNDIIGNMKVFRASGLAAQVEDKADASYHAFARSYYGAQIYGFVLRFWLEFGGILYVGGYLALSLLIAHQPFADSLVFLGIFFRLLPRILVVQEGFYQAHTYQIWYVSWRERYNHIVSHLEKKSGWKSPVFERELRVQDLHFRFPNGSQDILSGVDWCLKRGESLAIVGESGSGKSTIVDLVVGLLRPTKGRIALDDIPLEDVDVNMWRSRIGIVLQDSPVLHTTILENIALGDPKPDVDRAIHCSKLAYIWEFIEGLPEGVYTQVGEKGGRLSGGEKQRIALARALYREPWLLILDEATSALDGDSEIKIQDALEGLKGTITILIIAHRLKSVQVADRIAVLDQGCIAEIGSWAELVSRPNGLFRKMTDLQGLNSGTLPLN